MYFSFDIMSAGMRVYVRVAAHLRGRVGGLCGNFDGDTENDFTTRQGIVESTAELFGNSWKVSPSCPDVADQDLRDPCAVSSTQIHAHIHISAHTHTHIWRSMFLVVWQISFAKSPVLLFLIDTNAEAHYLLSLCLVQLNPHRMTWARKRCAILTQELFSLCHAEVPFQQYYDWCVFDACG